MPEHFSWVEAIVAVATALNVVMNLSIKGQILALELRLTNKMYKLINGDKDD